MEFTNTFQVSADVDETFAALSDLTRVAPCLPGAELDEVTGDGHTGSIRVKVGPLAVDYRGTARVVDADADAGRIRVEASGDEERGPGTALADIVATLRAVEDGTEVTVATELEVTGKPAQFGRAVLADVAERVITTFAARLSDQFTASVSDDEDTAAGDGPERAAATARDDSGGVDAAAGVDEAADVDGTVDAEHMADAAVTADTDVMADTAATADEDPPGGGLLDPLAHGAEFDPTEFDPTELDVSRWSKRIFPLAAVAAVALVVLVWLRRRR